VAAGMTLVIATRGIDISVGAVVALSGAVAALMIGGQLLIVDGHPVHVSRVLKQFRDEGLIELEHHQLTIRDVPQLQRIAGFNSAYLRLRGAPDPPAPGSGAHG